MKKTTELKKLLVEMLPLMLGYSLLGIWLSGLLYNDAGLRAQLDGIVNFNLSYWYGNSLQVDAMKELTFDVVHVYILLGLALVLLIVVGKVLYLVLIESQKVRNQQNEINSFKIGE